MPASCVQDTSHQHRACPQGDKPHCAVQIYSVAHNQLTGSMPSFIANSMLILELSSNNLT